MTEPRTLETIKAEIKEWLSMEQFPQLHIDVIIKYVDMAHLRGQMDAGKTAMEIVDKQLADVSQVEADLHKLYYDNYPPRDN